MEMVTFDVLKLSRLAAFAHKLTINLGLPELKL